MNNFGSIVFAMIIMLVLGMWLGSHPHPYKGDRSRNEEKSSPDYIIIIKQCQPHPTIKPHPKTGVEI